MDIAKLLKENRQSIIEIAAKYGAHNVRVFGSVVRGKADDKSDIDLLVYLEPQRSLVDWLTLMDELQVLLGRPVDVVEEGALQGRMKEEVLKEAISL